MVVSWRKSSYSQTVNDCVETAVLPGGARGVRDSKLGGSSPVLSVPAAQFAAFVDLARGAGGVEVD